MSLSDPDLHDAFTHRAAIYAKHRWPYDSRAVDALFESGLLPENPSIADVGAGPGSLTAQLLPRAGLVYGIEPNSDMRAIAEQRFAERENFKSIDGTAEATGLDARCVDSVAVGRAIQWFGAPSALCEFVRIGRDRPTLAIFRVAHRPSDVRDAENSLHCEGCGWDTSIGRDLLLGTPTRRPLDYFFDKGHFARYAFSGLARESLQDFLGRLSSHSGAPLRGTARFARLEAAAREVFVQLAEHDALSVPYETLLYLGKVGTATP